MHEIIRILQSDSSDPLTFLVLDPDLGSGHYAGEQIDIGGEAYIHRSLKSWCALAELLGYRMRMPHSSEQKHLVTVRYEKLQPLSSFHADAVEDEREKYGSLSIFARINKLEEPTFAWHYFHALEAVKIHTRKRILNLGINKGYEFLGIQAQLTPEQFAAHHFTGIDYAASAIAKAQQLLPQPNVSFYCHDINQLRELSLPRQDLILSIGTLQSPGIETKPLIMSLVQEYLTPDGALILGFPNARWIDGELIYGARVPNYPYPEMSLLIKDIYWIKKYLQQHKFRVTITGKEYLFLTATKIGRG